MKWNDRRLLRTQAYINGRWEDADSGAPVEVLNPATGDRLGTVPNLAVAQVRRSIQAAHQALPGWASRTARDRAVLLRRWFDLMLAHQDDLATIMTAEQGKPWSEAKGE